MGLPELTFSLKKAADNVATRVSSGIVAMILRDAKANGLLDKYCALADEIFASVRANF